MKEQLVTLSGLQPSRAAPLHFARRTAVLLLEGLIIKIAGSGSMSVFGSGAARLPGFDEAGRPGQFFKDLSCFLRGQEEKIPRIE